VGDLVQELYNIERFVKVKDQAASLLSMQKQSGWSGPTAGVKRKYDAEEGMRIVTASSGDNAAWRNLHHNLAADRPMLHAADPDIIQLDFRLGGMGDDTIIPFFDKDMNLIAYKRRRPGGKAMAAAGADFSTVLYGEWLDDGSAPVLLCEGESDVWAATYVLPHWSVLAVPTGVGAHPKQAHKLAGRDVVLAFDGDEAGRTGLLRWYEALKSVAKSVRIVIMPDGVDVATAPNLSVLVDRAVSVLPIPNRIEQREDGLYRKAKSEKGESEQLSNFRLHPKRKLEGDTIDAWEVRVEPQGVDAVITTDDLANKRSMVAWSARYGGSWVGADNDSQQLQMWLQSVEPFLAAGFTTRVAGLHEGHYVLPGATIGHDHWIYAPGNNDVQMERYLEHLTSNGDWQFVQRLTTMRALHNPSVMDPILSWLALAPIRSLFDTFPTLAVLGGSGTGKTTLLETVLQNFSGSTFGVNLTSTTRYAIQAITASTNAIPVWFDEYRPGAAQDAIIALDQTIRDAYNGHGSIKGGMGDHWAQVRQLAAEAPMIVSGEDAFQETSHLERIIPIYLPRDGRNADVLQEVRGWDEHPFAWKWLESMLYGLSTDEFDLTVTPVEVEGLAPRMQFNLGLLNTGWGVLQYVCEQMGTDLGDPDWSLVLQTWGEESNGSPVLDALRWIIDEPNANEFIAHDEDHIFLKPTNFVTYVKRHSEFKLPGNAKAVERLLLEQYQGERTRTRIFGQQVRVIAVAKSLLDEIG
jgi:hypothetical protein